MTELEAEARTRTLSDAQRLAVARARVQVDVLRAHVLRSLTRRLDGSLPGAEGSIDKLLGTATEQRLARLALDLDAGALTGERATALSDYLYSRAASIAGGTSQVQRTIIAERLLGLPRGS
jgi:alkylation response protein AidB-like acyl-CoA dehydrogenase